MSKKEQAPVDSPLGTTIDELDHRHIAETKTPKSLLFGGITALVVAVVVALIFHNHMEEKKAAAEAVGSAVTPEELQAIAEDHAGSVSAGTALLELSNQQIAEGRFDEGVTTLDSFLEDYSKHPLAGRALIAKASALIRLDRAEDAITTLDQFSAKHSDSPLSDIATLLRGDIEKGRGNIDAAQAAYTIVASSKAAGGTLAQLATSRQNFVSYTSPREVEPAPKPEPEHSTDGNLTSAPTAPPELDTPTKEIATEKEAAALKTTTDQESTPEADPAPASAAEDNNEG